MVSRAELDMKDAIAQVLGRRVWDSRGRPTVEAEVRLRDGTTARAIAPAGASTGSGEAIDLRDGGDFLGGWGVSRAVANVNGDVKVDVVADNNWRRVISGAQASAGVSSRIPVNPDGVTPMMV